MRKCAKCKANKFLVEFSKDASKHDGIHRYCKKCLAEYKKKHKRKWDLKLKYNITVEQYQQMFIEQNGCCRICGTHQLLLNKRLCVDHDHESGEIRGLLCNDCNRALGLLKDDVNALRNALEYLEVR